MCRKWILIDMALALCIVPASIVGSAEPIPGETEADPSLVGWWKLDETSGEIAADSTVQGYHGKLKGGPAWVKGLKGNALQFDGTDDYVAITSAYYGRAGHLGVTVAAWIRTRSMNDQVIISFDRHEYWRLEVNGTVAVDGQVGWSVMTDAGRVDLASRTSVTDGRWRHVAGVFDAGRITIYIDGVPDATIVAGRTFGTGKRRYGFLGVGSQADTFDGLKGPESYFAGELDDVRLYNRALSQAEIEQMALNGLGNDMCRYARAIGEVENLPFDTSQATHDGQDIVMRSPNLWYLYTPSCTGVATVSLAGSQYDTMLAAYLGAECHPGRERLIAFNDDFGGLTSQVLLDVVAEEAYLIEVGGFDLQTGQGVLTVSCESIVPAEFDLGDAPDSSNDDAKRMTAYSDGGQGIVQGRFPTAFDDREGAPCGPLHLAPLAVAHLGEAVTLEIEAEKGVDEDEVNNIDPAADEADADGADDGVLLPLTLPHGKYVSLYCIISVIDPERDLWINVWFDWNRDGDWDDDTVSDPDMVAGERHVSEWAVQNQYLYGLPIGTHPVMTHAFLPWHPAKGPDEVWMRITLSESPWKGGSAPGAPGNGGSGPPEGYEIGETEDYLILPELACTLCEDFNDDGVIDFDDLIAVMYQWLDNCLR